MKTKNEDQKVEEVMNEVIESAWQEGAVKLIITTSILDA
jgi:hypothetical protein